MCHRHRSILEDEKNSNKTLETSLVSRICRYRYIYFFTGSGPIRNSLITGLFICYFSLYSKTFLRHFKKF